MAEVGQKYRGSVSTLITPGLMWIQLAKDRFRIEEIEQNLSQEIRRSDLKHIKYEVDECDFVAVRNTVNTRLWHRGKVVDIHCRSRQTEYKVFLIDHGVYITSPPKNIVPLIHSNIKNIKPLTYKLCLHGLLPLVPIVVNHDLIPGLLPDNFSVNRSNTELAYSIAPDWMPISLRYAQDLIQNTQKVFIKIEDCKSDVLYGDVLLRKDGLLTSLSDELCNKNYGIRSERTFRKQVTGIYNEMKKETLDAQSISPVSLDHGNEDINICDVTCSIQKCNLKEESLDGSCKARSTPKTKSSDKNDSGKPIRKKISTQELILMLHKQKECSEPSATKDLKLSHSFASSSDSSTNLSEVSSNFQADQIFGDEEDRTEAKLLALFLRRSARQCLNHK